MILKIFAALRAAFLPIIKGYNGDLTIGLVSPGFLLPRYGVPRSEGHPPPPPTPLRFTLCTMPKLEFGHFMLLSLDFAPNRLFLAPDSDRKTARISTPDNLFRSDFF